MDFWAPLCVCVYIYIYITDRELHGFRGHVFD
jgi:hypothetical protein